MEIENEASCLVTFCFPLLLFVFPFYWRAVVPPFVFSCFDFLAFSVREFLLSAHLFLFRPPPAPYPRLYDHLPFWRSDLAGCDVVMEGLGDVDPR